MPHPISDHKPANHLTVEIITFAHFNKLELAFPSYATAGSAGMDLRAAIEQDIILTPGFGNVTMIPTGIGIKLPYGYEAQIRPRSGLAAKYCITLINTPGTIDCDYRGEIKIPLINLGTELFTVTPGMRIAQMVVMPYNIVDWQKVENFDENNMQNTRGNNGFGSTGSI